MISELHEFYLIYRDLKKEDKDKCDKEAMRIAKMATREKRYSSLMLVERRFQDIVRYLVQQKFKTGRR